MFRRRVFIQARSLFLLTALLLLSNAATAQIDNCCFVDRQCDADEEWVSGYWAFQNNQCSVSSQQHQLQGRQQRSPSQIDNCCFIGWQCSTDEEWNRGYWAFQRDHCDSRSLWQRQGPNRNLQADRVSVVIDVTDRDGSTNLREDGLTITIVPGPPGELCTVFPYLDRCQYPELYQ